MNHTTLMPIRHVACGRPITWRLSTDGRPGAPRCAFCGVDVSVDDLPAGPLCVATTRTS